MRVVTFQTVTILPFVISTNGVPLFQSSSVSLWPVYLIILYLPPGICMNSENIGMAGLWYGKKPPMKHFLSPIMESLSQLSTLGISISTSHGLRTFRTKLVVGVFDLIAKRDVLRAKQFNGKYVTVYGKTRHMGFFVKVEFDASMISSTLELTRVQVLDQSCASTALCLRSRHTLNNGEITVQRRCYARVWRFRILRLRVARKSIKWTSAEPFEMNVKIEQELNIVVDNSRLFLDGQEAKKVSERTVVR